MIPHAQIEGKTPFWLCELELAGRVYRFASESVIVTDDAGTDYLYGPGLDLREVIAEPDSLSFSVDSPDDWAQEVNRGHVLEGRAGRVRRHYSGQTLEQSPIILAGLTSDVEYGDITEPLSLTLEPSDNARSQLIPPPDALIDSPTWPVTGGLNTEGRALGKYLAFIIGCPGHAPNEAAPLPAVPCLGVEWASTNANSKVGIAAHAVDATKVRLWEESATPPSSGDQTAIDFLDLLDITRSVTLVGTGMTQSADWYAGFQDDSTYGGGLKNRTRTGPLRNLDEVLFELGTNYTTMDLDRGRMESEAPRLARYKIDTYINTPTPAIEVIRRHILPELPVVERRGPDGVWWQHWRLDATEADSVADLNADRGDIHRVGRGRLRNPDVRNEFTLKYRRLREGSSWFTTRILTAEFQTTGIKPYGTKGDSRVFGSGVCRTSQALYGYRPADAVGLPWCWDDGTAAALLEQWALAQAIPRLGLRYIGPPSLEAIELGAVVTITDSELHLSGALALVDGRIDGLGQTTLDLTLLHAPGFAARSTA